MNLRDQLKCDEGIKYLPYKDIKGILTIGVGRNLNNGVHPDEVELMLTNDIAIALQSCHKIFPTFDTFGQARKDALTNMAFNTGETGLRGFHDMVTAINHNDWIAAKKAAINSAWYTQVGARAKRIVDAFGVSA